MSAHGFASHAPPATSPLMDTAVRESGLRRITHVAAAVILAVAGLLVGAMLSPELGATLLAGGIHLAVEAFISGHDRRHHPEQRRSFAPGLALA